MPLAVSESINSVEQPHPNPQIVSIDRMPKTSSSLGVASLVLGSIAFLICWIPLLGMIGLPLSGLGAILGAIGLIVALLRKGRGIGFPIAGTAISLVAAAVSISMTAAAAKAIVATGDAIEKSRKESNETKQQVVGGGEEQKDAEWANAKQAVQNGDIRVRITGIKIEKVSLKGIGGEGKSADNQLVIYLTIENVADGKKADYTSWGGQRFSFGDGMKLTDNFDNRYKEIDYGFGQTVVGHTTSDSIYPGKSINDVLVFEEPVDKAEYLRLELPASNFHGKGKLRLQIPSDLITR